RVRRPRDGVPHLREDELWPGDGQRQADPRGLRAEASGRALLRQRSRAWLGATGVIPYPVLRRRLMAPSSSAAHAAGMDAIDARTRAWLEQPRHHLLHLRHPDYPALLRRIADPPRMLFVAGDPALLWHPSVAVVGSRAPSAGGADTAFGFARAFAASGLAVASGLAAGIDTAAHAGALSAGGATIAVLGTG